MMYGNINNYCIQQFQYCFNFSNSKEINHNHSHNKIKIIKLIRRL